MTTRALCIGINDYPGTGSDLSGCVNDAKDWQDALNARGFSTTSLLDGEATKQNMAKEIEALVQQTASGELAVITFSGHGSWIVDEDDDEPDGRDEVLCPHDIAQGSGNPLTDDELYDIFIQRERGARVVLISDSCHSGSVHKLMAATTDDADPRRVRYLAPDVFLPKAHLSRARAATRLKLSRSRTSALLLSGCKDTEFSYDANFGGRPNGAFTYYALETLASLPKGKTYRHWHAAIAKRLPSVQYPQTPGLNGSSTQRGWKVLA